MKVTAVEPVEVLKDVLCDVCGASTRAEEHGLQFRILTASWGFGCVHDGRRYEVRLCETCFFMTLASLKRERMASTMFNDDSEELGDFGLVTRDDPFNDVGGSTRCCVQRRNARPTWNFSENCAINVSGAI